MLVERGMDQAVADAMLPTSSGETNPLTRTPPPRSQSVFICSIVIDML